MNPVKPFRKVTSTGGGVHWWELRLECGHRTARRVRSQRVGRTVVRRPAPARVRCQACWWDSVVPLPIEGGEPTGEMIEVTDNEDAPDGARIVDEQGRTIERHGDEWWVIA